uniref:Colony stimulating factor 3 n=1 Tax=Pelodiscus sinensis TaxID=13735 RepID=K7FXS9_PELSI
VLLLLVSTVLGLGVTMLHAAPLPEFSGDQDFQQFLQKDLEYIRKIKGDVARLQELMCSTFQLCSEDELLLVKQKLGITQAPLDQCHSKTFQVSGCPRSVRASTEAWGALGLREATCPGQGLGAPGVSGPGSLPSSAPCLPLLQMEDLGLNTVTYPVAEGQGPLPSFSSDFEKQASGFIILANFQRFLEMALRALRHLTQL